MELLSLITLCAFVTSIKSSIVKFTPATIHNHLFSMESLKKEYDTTDNTHEDSCDKNAIDGFEDDTDWRVTPDPSVLARLNRKQSKARNMTDEELYKRGYPETAIRFDSPLDEKIYYYKRFSSISERKCRQYNNEIIRQKQNRNEETDNGYGVIGGNSTSIEYVPYVGGLGYKMKSGKLEFLCGCTLISYWFALTAAHCALKEDNPNGFIKPSIARFGTTNIEEPADDFKIALKQYEDYHYDNKLDIALVKLKKKIKFTKSVQPACLWRSEHTGSLKKVSVSGWGTTDPAINEMTDILQTADLEIIDTEKCAEIYKDNGQIDFKPIKQQICAGKLSGGVDTCQGDSGGPLAGIKKRTNYIVGIVSQGKGCAQSNVPAIYVRVSSFVSWIENNVWKKYE
ncbi:PREDICTED: trypsin-1-like [Papilio xuthus]|uniref:Trypsin-1-like n=1 Tax=Papilio xuthus TaxID=66420 RepID=A0AAJ6ZCT6_PAPXU|nr:PREDICTED: trypsin-1-like [Papilio xuthus]